ncbi:MAG: hypothetical protein PHQ93_02985 [Sulfurimonas sp.]|uniref:rolling circle replication-associated protein n=1 Tax=Sulfurimonas sp. TaxID=2022749 RepID=UPI00260F9589|nr:hypothetical protein [Sulfurimonas sp.]MDD5400136.1 hypothetical protein [Sulfurimonas sp.]
MTNYGLNKQQIKNAKNKLVKNKEFMTNNGIHLDNKIVPFADFVANSYMNADRYIAELQHRAWSIFDYSKERDLKNIFITLTLPSHWHPKKTYKGRLITNKAFAGRKYITTINKIKFLNCHVIQRVPFIDPILDFSNTIDKYTPRNASIELSKMLKKIFDDRSYKNIQKDDRCYLRVTEPHKDGTPHLHISLFVPADSVDSIVKAVNRLFPAPLSQVETNVKSPISYLMKYILKTLDDLREDSDKITNLTLWYLYHGICRFYTSRTFVALEVYRKLNGMYTLLDLTAAYKNHDVNVYVYSDTKKISFINNEFGTIYVSKPVNWAEKLEDYTYLEAEYEPLFREKIQKPVDVIIDGEEFIFYQHTEKKLMHVNKKLVAEGQNPISLSSILHKHREYPYQMSDLKLYDYFQNLDIETCDLKHYANTKNILIDRGLLLEEKVDLALYQDDFFQFESEVV